MQAGGDVAFTASVTLGKLCALLGGVLDRISLTGPSALLVERGDDIFRRLMSVFAPTVPRRDENGQPDLELRAAQGPLDEALYARIATDPQVALASPVLELGTYCGYSALRMARAAPNAQIFSVEFAAANAAVARRIWTHAGVADRITCVVGTIGDGGRTLDALAEHGFATGNLDFVFIDHDKNAYLPDLQSILDRGWLHPGAIVVADNVKVPGSPRYRAYMKDQQGKTWNTVEHNTHVEYQNLLTDLVLESDYLG